MYNLLPPEMQIAGYHLLEEPGRLGLGELLLDSLAEVAVAELGDDVGVVLGVVDLEELQHARCEV